MSDITQTNLNSAKQSQRPIPSGFLLLFVAITLCLISIVLAFRFVTPASFPHEFSWSAIHCWIYPCKVSNNTTSSFLRQSSAFTISDLSLPRREYVSVAAAPNNFLVAVTQTGQIELHVAGESPLILNQAEYNGRVIDASVASDGTVIASYEFGILLWITPSRGPSPDAPILLMDSDKYEAPTAISVASGGSAVAIYSDTVRYWPSPNTEPSVQMSPFTRSVAGLDERSLIGESIEEPSREPIQTYDENPSLPISHVALSESTIAAASRETIYIWSLESQGGVETALGRRFLKLQLGSQNVQTMALSSIGTIVAGFGDGIFTRSIESPSSSWNHVANSAEYLPPIALASNPDGVIFSVHQGGETRLWNVSLTTPLAVIVAGFFIVLGIPLYLWLRTSTNSAVVAVRRSTIPRFAPDSPVDDFSDATLSMQKLVSQLAGFIRNPDSSGPMTIAITGEWGSGKTTLMNLLAKDLHSAKCRCIWFNAWHHQSEAHLFAALMETIRSFQPPVSVARPSFSELCWSYMERVEFHFELFVVHLRRTPVRVVVFLLSVALLVVLFGWGVGNLQLEKESAGSDLGSVVTSILSSIATLLLLISKWNPVRAYGVSAASLSNRAAHWWRFPSFGNRLSFRYRFGQAFGDVCEAFGERPVVIIVDDLDRCRPEQVVETLEAINFVTSNGKCFVVLGISERQVERAIGLEYAEIAEEIGRDSSLDGAGGTGSKRGDSEEFLDRMAYARKYLDKLVNIRVGVPEVAEEELQRLREGEGW